MLHLVVNNVIHNIFDYKKELFIREGEGGGWEVVISFVSLANKMALML